MRKILLFLLAALLATLIVLKTGLFGLLPHSGSQQQQFLVARASPTMEATVTLPPIQPKPTQPRPTPTPGTVVQEYPTSDGHIYWDGGWETGDTSQWDIHTGGHWGDSNVQVVTSPVRWGRYAGKLTLNPSGNGSARAEISSSQQDTGGYAGQEWFYSFSVYFPSNPDKATGWTDWNDFTQWMDLRAKCSPPLQFDVTPQSDLIFSHQITTQEAGNCGYDKFPSQDYKIGPIVYDQWIDFTVLIKWSEDPQIGFAQVWRNNQLVFPLTHMQTLDPQSNGVYMEQAMYRPDTPGTSIVYIDGTRRHDAYNGMHLS